MYSSTLYSHSQYQKYQVSGPRQERVEAGRLCPVTKQHDEVMGCTQDSLCSLVCNHNRTQACYHHTSSILSSTNVCLLQNHGTVHLLVPWLVRLQPLEHTASSVTPQSLIHKTVRRSLSTFKHFNNHHRPDHSGLNSCQNWTYALLLQQTDTWV